MRIGVLVVEGGIVVVVEVVGVGFRWYCYVVSGKAEGRTMVAAWCHDEDCLARGID